MAHLQNSDPNVHYKIKALTLSALCAESSACLMRDRMDTVHKEWYIGKSDVICT